MFSTIYSGGQIQIMRQFNVSHFVVTLGVGLVNLGIAIGPLFGAPLSELYGRQPIYLVAAVTFTCFAAGSALANSIQTLLVCRFLSALFGSAVFSNFGGSLSDLFTPSERAPLVALFALILQGAPTLGPVVGSLIGQYVSWRWVLAVPAIWAGGVTVGALIWVPETEVGVVNARQERKRLGKKARLFVANLPEDTSPREFWRKALLTPLVMLYREPIVLATSLYHAFIYGLLFILLEAYPYIFETRYHFNLLQTGLVFLSPAVGNVLGVLLYFGYLKHKIEKEQVDTTTHVSNSSGEKVHTPPAHDGSSQLGLKPETRLPGVLIAACLVPIGLFWFALTCSSPSTIHPIIPILSGLPTGAGMTLLQLSLSNYYIDLYPSLSASALAANLLVRHVLATWFPTFALPMYKGSGRLGVRGVGLILAGISLLGVPGGWALWVYGARLRKRSRWAVQDDDPVVSEDAEAPSISASVAIPEKALLD